MIENVTFDEIEIGQSASLTKTITQQDLELFAVMSGDANPAHLDPAFAKSTPFEGIVAHGLLTAGLFSNLFGNKLPGAGAIYVNQSLGFLEPVRVGDAITATVTATAKRAERRIVEFDCVCLNQHGKTVLRGRADVIAPADKKRVHPSELAEVTLRHHDSFTRLINATRAIPAIPCAVAHPCDETSLKGVIDAAAQEIIAPLLIGPEGKIRAVAERAGLDLGDLEIIDAAHSHAAAETAVGLIRSGRAELLMKGSLHTDELMSAVVAREGGLRTERRISHVFLMDVPTYSKPLLITDAAINIMPSLETKADIVQNAIDLFAGLGLGEPKVAILSAVETINAKMPSTIEAAALCKMADRGQITGALLDGPLALDNAISMEAARIKEIRSKVAGQADILLVPDLEAGNMLAKNLSFLSNADAAGIVLGARVPIILTSRADNVRTRMASCAVAALYANALRSQVPS